MELGTPAWKEMRDWKNSAAKINVIGSRVEVIKHLRENKNGCSQTCTNACKAEMHPQGNLSCISNSTINIKKQCVDGGGAAAPAIKMKIVSNSFLFLEVKFPTNDAGTSVRRHLAELGAKNLNSRGRWSDFQRPVKITAGHFAELHCSTLSIFSQ